MELNDVKIIDLTRLLPGPYATQLLADLGAEVIKVEDPDVGDYARFIEPRTSNDVGVVFSAVNRGKKSVTIDLKDSKGLQTFYELVKDADVLIEQFRPGVAERLSVDYDSIKEQNGSIVYCSLSGYGQDGPYRDRVGHDLNYASVAGFVDMTRESSDDKPAIPGYPIGDMAGGTFAALSIVSALLSDALGQSGGNYVDVSMTDAVLSFSQAVGTLAFNGENPRPDQTELTGKFPCYDIYETADNKYVSIAALETKFWKNLCEALDLRELIEKHRSEEEEIRATVQETLTETFRSQTRAEWEDELGDKDVMFAPVQTPLEAVNDPHIQTRNIVKGTDGPNPRIGFPAKALHGLNGDETQDVPEMGEHTFQILKSAGLDEETLKDMQRRDVI